MKKYSRKHIGEKHITNEGYELTIIDGGSKNGYCTIQIKNWIVEASYSNITAKKIKYPYKKTYFNVGHIGHQQKQKMTKINKKAYNVWKRMLERCYSAEKQKANKTYIGCKVDKEWHNLETFTKWFIKYYIDGWQIDKDLLSGSQKIYSKKTCCFLLPVLNVFLQEKQKNNISGFIEIQFVKNKWRASICINGKFKSLGVYQNIEDAKNAYRKAKKEKLLTLIEKYSDKLESRAIKALKKIKL